jgi:hypothetical protein
MPFDDLQPDIDLAGDFRHMGMSGCANQRSKIPETG